MEVRLQKYIADCGIASRRKAEEYILAGRVTVNSEIVTELGTKINTDSDVITFDGEAVIPLKNYTYIMLHKPEGYITSASDQFDRPTVLDLLKDIEARLYPVGRLDYDTSGLLLLTDDGDLTYRLTHPRHNIDKVYAAKVIGVPNSAEHEKIRQGIMLDGYMTKPSKIEIMNFEDGHATLKITIKEGRNRQVRKMLSSINHEVVSLKRIATGELFLGELKKGEYRYLTDDEVKYLKESSL